MKRLKKLLSDSFGCLAFSCFTAAESRDRGSLGSVKIATPVMARGVALGRDAGIGSRVSELELLNFRIAEGSSRSAMASRPVGRVSARSTLRVPCETRLK